MRLPFRKKEETPAWVDSLNWTPEQPFGDAPRFVPGNDIGWTDDWRIEPKPAAPQPEPIADFEPQASPVLIQAAPEPQPEVPAEPVAPPAPANLNRAPRLLAVRLGIGLAQGVALALLTLARSAAVWPGSDPHLYSAFHLALLLAPLVLLAGLGAVENRALLLWSGTVAALLATVGLDAQWSQSLSHLALAGLVLAAAQSGLHVALNGGGYIRTAGRMAARLCLWALLTSFGFALAAGVLFFGLPAQGGHAALDLAIPLLLALCSALAFALTAGFDKRH